MTDRPVLVVGDYRKSSWSMRPFVGLVHKGVDFDVEMIRLDQPGSKRALLAASPSGLVPALRDGELVVCDSLAILEYAEERFPGPPLLPEDLKLRAEARSLAARMHSGWAALRAGMSFEDSLRRPPPEVPEKAQKQAGRVLDLWEEQLGRHAGAGAYLVGPFGLADCMFAPVCQRFAGFGQDLGGHPRAAAYIDRMLDHPGVRTWLDRVEPA